MSYKSRKSKSLNCKLCGEEVKNVDEETIAVTCWRCVNKMMRGEINKCDESAKDSKKAGHDSPADRQD